MRADKQDPRRSTANFHFDVVTGASVQVVRVAPRMQTSARKRILYEIRSGIELGIARHVSLADLPPKDSHVGDQFVTQFDLRHRQRRGARDISSRHFHSKPPK